MVTNSNIQVVTGRSGLSRVVTIVGMRLVPNKENVNLGDHAIR